MGLTAKAQIEGVIQIAYRRQPAPLVFRFKRNRRPGTIDISFGKDSNEVWLDLEGQFGKKILSQLWNERFQEVPIKITIG